MTDTYRVGQFLKLAQKILELVDVSLKKINLESSHVISAQRETHNALTNLDEYELQAFIEYQGTLEYLLFQAAEEDWSSYVDLLNSQSTNADDECSS